MARKTITQRYLIRCVSPLYLKAEEEPLLPISYVVLDGTCYIIDINRLISERKELIVDFRNKLEKDKDKFELKAFLDEHDLLSKEFLEDMCVYRAKTDTDIENGVIYPFIKNAFNDPFIPADSIKRALKIAILEDRVRRYLRSPNKIFLSKKRSSYYRRYKKKKRIAISRLLGEARKGELEKWEDLETLFFGEFPLPKEKKLLEKHKKEDHNDIFRTIFITDTLKAGKAHILPTQMVKKENKNIEFLESVSTKTYREFLDAETSIETRLTFDIELWKKFSRSKNRLKLPFSSLGELFKKADKFYRGIWEDEYKYWTYVQKKRKVHEHKLSSFSDLQKLSEESLFEEVKDEIDIESIREFYARKPDKKGYLLHLGGSDEQMALILRKALRITKTTLPTREVIAEDKKINAPMGWVLLYRG